MKKDMFDLDLKIQSSKGEVEPNSIRLTFGCTGGVASKALCSRAMCDGIVITKNYGYCEA
ncbi:MULTISPECIES: FDLD family class I lanthipeptide [Bacillus subtilis group]|uniref:FDLD family class I lanthipeptide n=1 Tax=Bacillus subtilis group TaxID=653685 RepID=UPI0006487974|nr:MULTISPECIES: FDLD family class I lanthipeptide [Bacillus subtilis group]MCY9135593.1 FDLD family class I lanthipeptide [Bacillus atrophaeus]MCZ4248659.1 FDLD family class I lanthipeptide [Bacillus amyloliquefaciens]MDQ8091283.1 FDLD family class I lanthipeptide [Bacillus amyloliquefaciens]MDU0812816.1 FDLD family class I lanthipeptide [Bacillus siamensis]MEC0767213.1 FDLD family class I lanthipeptide [Bacillus atrophaeus]